jgi:hypothetical protein
MLAARVATGHITIAAIFMLSFLSGCGQAFGGPAYQAMIPSLVPRRDLEDGAHRPGSFAPSVREIPACGGEAPRVWEEAWEEGRTARSP